MRRILVYALAAAAVLSLLVLVPTSPALLVDMPQVLAVLGSSELNDWGQPMGLQITVYSLMIAVGAGLGFALTGMLNRKGIGVERGVAAALVSGVFALVCSHLLFCVLRWSYIINDLGENAAFIFMPWKGGFTMYGAILGGLAGLVVYARAAKVQLVPLMDTCVPGMALLVLLGRLAERYTLQGMGSYVANDALNMLPFMVVGEWGDKQLQVFMYEALMAAAALIVTLVLLGRRAPAGRAAETGLGLISLGQIIFDSWRGDELICFGFVRLNMIAAAVVLTFVLVTRLVRIVRRQGWKAWSILRPVLFVVCAGIVIAIEFALDKSAIDNTLLYGVMAAALVAMGFSVFSGDGRQTENAVQA